MNPLLSIALFAPADSTYRQILLEHPISSQAIGTVIGPERLELIGEVDVIIYIIEADKGLSPSDIELFQHVRQFQVPTLILVTSLAPQLSESDRWDFDDVMLLVNRVLEPSFAPFLVLHGEDGSPSGLFDLSHLSVINNSADTPSISEPDEDLLALTKDFKDEFDESGFLMEDFSSGLSVMALPFIPEKGIGWDQLSEILTTLQLARS